MDKEYSVEIIKEMEARFHRAALRRPMRVERYEAGEELVYDVSAVAGSGAGTVKLAVDKFVGGGFAGQVYRVKVLDITAASGPVGGLEKGGIYAMKILIPPGAFSLWFRNLIYRIGFQGPFQLQVNPAAARAGAIWQKFIRRAAAVRFGDERAVADIHGTFVDSRLGSCGELSEWVEGRTWQLEPDDRVDALRRWKKGKPVDPRVLGSPEFRAKYEFMRSFVELLHRMGAHEFARQYEWSTCKSQPNCLKRAETEGSPAEGLTAIDFRAGLALLPFLPMSPGDFRLIIRGIMRGSLVQFDRGDLTRLENFTKAHAGSFAGMGSLLDELKRLERVYRYSVPDITHNHLRLLYRPEIWKTIFRSAVTGWKTRNLIDGNTEEKLGKSRVLTLLYMVTGMVPFLGKFARKIWGRSDWRAHYREMLWSRAYLKRAVDGRIAEKLAGWHRAGRVSEERARKLAGAAWRFAVHLPLSVLPAGLHRFFTDLAYAKERLDFLIARPVRLYFDAALREQWLSDMIEEGIDRRLLVDEDARVIQSQIKDPFIQKYLKSLAVHVCTLPVTQVVSVAVAFYYVMTNPQLSWQEAGAMVAFILVAFQLTPISPGSLVRGLYVVYLVIKERNVRDYTIALFLGFFKYIGYLAFPIQMTHRYPALARFMAGYWATEAVHAVPVFGERGALLEHGVFTLFYNRPLTIRRRMEARRRLREHMKPRYLHVVFYVLLGAALFAGADVLYLHYFRELPDLKKIWPLAVLVPLLCGALVTVGAGGASMAKRIIGGLAWGAAVGVLATAAHVFLAPGPEAPMAGAVAVICAWRVFIFSLLSVAGVLLTEFLLPEPREKK
ncbi:MAG TPA: hypothetical protein ENN21_02290 [Spirochaetes bacterium]|nr:hypothetical protein [Spirochaetota bacterium]